MVEDDARELGVDRERLHIMAQDRKKWIKIIDAQQVRRT